MFFRYLPDKEDCIVTLAIERHEATFRVGVAIRNPKDSPNLKLSRKIATGRLQKLAGQTMLIRDGMVLGFSVSLVSPIFSDLSYESGRGHKAVIRYLTFIRPLSQLELLEPEAECPFPEVKPAPIMIDHGRWVIP